MTFNESQVSFQADSLYTGYRLTNFTFFYLLNPKYGFIFYYCIFELYLKVILMRYEIILYINIITFVGVSLFIPQ